jgi:hypothetical protein
MPDCQRCHAAEALAIRGWLLTRIQRSGCPTCSIAPPRVEDAEGGPLGPSPATTASCRKVHLMASVGTERLGFLCASDSIGFGLKTEPTCYVTP